MLQAGTIFFSVIYCDYVIRLYKIENRYFLQAWSWPCCYHISSIYHTEFQNILCDILENMVIWVAVLPRVDQLTKVMPNFWRAVYFLLVAPSIGITKPLNQFIELVYINLRMCTGSQLVQVRKSGVSNKLITLYVSLTHWCRVTHICVGKLTINGSDNGLSPGRRQAIIWTNAGILLNRPLGTNFSEILIEI